MSDDLERANIITRPRRRSRSSGAVLNTPAAPSPSTTPTASSNAERTLLPSDVMELSRSASADHVVGAGGRRLSRSGFNPFGHSGGLSSSFRLNSAGSSFRAGAGVPVSSSALRSHASFLMMDIDAARQSVEQAARMSFEDDGDGGRLTRNMLGDAPAAGRSSGSERFRRACTLQCRVSMEAFGGLLTGV
jgi:hypothetical protein